MSMETINLLFNIGTLVCQIMILVAFVRSENK